MCKSWRCLTLCPLYKPHVESSLLLVDENESGGSNLGEATGAQVLQQERTRTPDRSVPVVGWLVGWLVGLLVGWLVGWLLVFLLFC